MSISIPVSWGELFDKVSILTIKSNRITDTGKLKNVRHELQMLLRICEDQVTMTSELQMLGKTLLEINEELWDIEDNIRLCEMRKDFGETFIELARSVYHTNDRRADVKAQINQILGSEVVEEKSYQDY